MGDRLPGKRAVLIVHPIVGAGRGIEDDVDRALDERDSGSGLAGLARHAEMPIDERRAKDARGRQQRPVRPRFSVRGDHARKARRHQHHYEPDAVGPGQVAQLDQLDPAVLRVSQAGHGEAGQQVAADQLQPGPHHRRREDHRHVQPVDRHAA